MNRGIQLLIALLLLNSTALAGSTRAQIEGTSFWAPTCRISACAGISMVISSRTSNGNFQIVRVLLTAVPARV